MKARSRQAASERDGTVSFENPMYDNYENSGTEDNGNMLEDSNAYGTAHDVRLDKNGYVADNSIQHTNDGYMDIPAQTVFNGNNDGYFDIAPSDSFDVNDSDEEDV